jgi:hypothetical protein
LLEALLNMGPTRCVVLDGVGCLSIGRIGT